MSWTVEGRIATRQYGPLLITVTALTERLRVKVEGVCTDFSDVEIPVDVLAQILKGRDTPAQIERARKVMEWFDETKSTRFKDMADAKPIVAGMVSCGLHGRLRTADD